ncbi:MAG TPA: prolyl-tRNA synthetase associated domain-containing protein [Aestuariivirgaceae bacterium]|nr:prolyl-tRNA synthetase associated domain-containing protein [Aestuariivirgaceae bacterium]
MPTTPDALFAYLDRLGIAHQTVTHPPLFTVEQSRMLRGEIKGAHTKNLFLKDKKHSVFLIVAGEARQVDLKSLHHQLGAGRFSFGSAALMHQLLGVEPGAVTPLGVINDTDLKVEVVIDRLLLESEIVNCHPLVNTMTTSLSSAGLIAFLTATGHEPRIISLSP